MEILALLLIFGSRTFVPALIFWSPFWGGLASLAADAFDTVIQDALGVEVIPGQYHYFDKAFDTYYLAIEAFVAWRLWPEPLIRYTAAMLFAIRLVGVVAFEILGWRGLLLAGPNVFEHFYLFVAAMKEVNPDFAIGSRGRLAVILVAVAAPKLVQEYVMHYREAQTWEFVKERIFRLD